VYVSTVGSIKATILKARFEVRSFSYKMVWLLLMGACTKKFIALEQISL
jgi:hypothetical protein